MRSLEPGARILDMDEDLATIMAATARAGIEEKKHLSTGRCWQWSREAGDLRAVQAGV